MCPTEQPNPHEEPQPNERLSLDYTRGHGGYQPGCKAKQKENDGKSKGTQRENERNTNGKKLLDVLKRYSSWKDLAERSVGRSNLGIED